MIRHYYTLKLVVKELQTLVGYEIMECYTQDKDAVALVIDCLTEYKFLRISCHSELSSIFIGKNFARAKKNSVDLFPELLGERLQSVTIAEFDRILTFGFINVNLIVHLFGGSRSNAFITNKGMTVINSLNSKNELAGKQIEHPIQKPPALEDFPSNVEIAKALAKCDILLGKHYAEEVLLKHKISAEKKIGEFANDELAELRKTAIDLRDECFSARKVFLLASPDGERLLSLLPISDFTIEAEFDSISEALQKRVGEYSRIANIESARKKALLSLSKQKKRLEDLLLNLKNYPESSERSDKYRRLGELLMTSPNPKQKAGSEIIIIDYDGNDALIPLSDKKNLLENAESYFKKAKAAKEEAAIKKRRIPETEKKLALLIEAIEKVDSARTFKELEKIKQVYKQFFYGKMKTEIAEQKYRTFDLGAGYKLYVGKSAANNDELTMKFAKPNDLWLHARGSAGSHAVLTLDKEQKPPKDILRKAAEITAYYSQSRNAKYTPVCYTLRKNVRKPKGAELGSVVISREQVIMVEPKLPEGSET